MKKLLLLFIVLFSVSQLTYAQGRGKKKEYKGYYGVGIGASLPMGDFAGPDDANFVGKQVTGIHIAFANAGYKIIGPVGLCAQLFAGANRSDFTTNNPAFKDDDAYWAYGGFLIGPLLSFDIAMFAIDVRPQYGITYISTPELNSDAGGVVFKGDRNSGTGYDLGATFRWKYSEKGSLGLNLDYFGTKVDYQREINNVTYEETQNINVLGVGLALVFAL
jgi:hypothetical protein